MENKKKENFPTAKSKAKQNKTKNKIIFMFKAKHTHSYIAILQNNIDLCIVAGTILKPNIYSGK